MPRVTFEQLLDTYQQVTFDPDGDEGLLSISSAGILQLLQATEADDRAAEDANLALLVDPVGLAVGQAVRVRVGAPRLALGLFARRFDDLLAGPEARLQEPRAYYVVDGGLHRGLQPPPPTMLRYRKTLELVSLFAEAASYLDRTRQELVFFRDGKFVVPVRYDTAALDRLSFAAADGLLEHFRDDVHKEQKLALLAEAIAHICEPQTAASRFAYLLQNLEALSEEVRKGYRLFASSFSYAKIRNEIEAAKVEYVGKIHRTLIDIQGQLLGIPVATIIVASQLKLATACGVESWTNLAVLAGSWIFVLLLLVSIINQWVTLQAISDEIASQQRRLTRDFAAISEQFSAVFAGLSGRINWHRGALLGVGLVAVAGAIFATMAYNRLTHVSMSSCVATPAPSTPVTGSATGPGASSERVDR